MFALLFMSVLDESTLPFASFFFKIIITVIIPLMFRSVHQNFMHLFFVMHAKWLHTSHPSWFDYPTNIWQGV
jgi:hypothetical protein